eukprot:CAMPEP_0198209720 /NCGR_PEP_ID=MMETSP1445-20131203/17692_1 /TAXON_ID=36898 /ORGANISM="Pyramimonas sp., Strain CCMP2087" /LENGTH=96 /DNA_ID=CAMNT_0043883585 /DNA_START=77 /DNA_END=363 /DNA_ORIENTATION=-
MLALGHRLLVPSPVGSSLRKDAQVCISSSARCRPSQRSLRVVEAAKDDDQKDEKKKRPRKPTGGPKGPGSAPMYMETVEQRNAAKAFRKGGADDGG